VGSQPQASAILIAWVIGWAWLTTPAFDGPDVPEVNMSR
jgi:hypothetical protein